MKIEKHHKGFRYTLSNENLSVGDKVFPIARGRCLDGGDWILHDFDFRDFMCGFPNDPHTIENLKYSKTKPEEVSTDKGYSPSDCYYKIIKKEQQVEDSEFKSFLFKSYKWIEVELDKTE